MHTLMQAEPIAAGLQISLGETILFGVIAVSMIIVAIFGLLITRKPVYTIISVIFVMVGLAFFYTMLEAPFMGVVQVVVYTGAILMMFLFVLMLIGVDSADSGHETLAGQRVVAVVGSLGTFALLTVILLKTSPIKALENVVTIPIGLEVANSQTNPVGVAQLIFTSHVLTLELTGTLLIVAALGAMTLTHRDRVRAKRTQEEIAHQKIQAFSSEGVNPNVLPNSGVYAESNSSANPALTAYGEPVENSVNRILKIRRQDRTVAQASPVTAARIAAGDLPSGPSTYGKVGHAQVWGMPGEAAPDHERALARLNELESGQAPDVPAVTGTDSTVLPESKRDVDRGESSEESEAAK
ncbi:MAG: NADH-quinone oxidoreductase subunit J [Actinomycetaceae bacterium]|nr:NADH-quinone oxidoreductase subunit J [Actinomycetaceae bacterium]MDY5854204.1 NADH-quinone oxidoreductase subunit J [Arcanobacterium sp.]